MNPHYPKYYLAGGREYPTNWQSPIPIYFLTVASDAIFRFAIGWRGSWEDKKTRQKRVSQCGVGGSMKDLTNNRVRRLVCNNWRAGACKAACWILGTGGRPARGMDISWTNRLHAPLRCHLPSPRRQCADLRRTGPSRAGVVPLPVDEETPKIGAVST